MSLKYGNINIFEVFHLELRDVNVTFIFLYDLKRCLEIWLLKCLDLRLECCPHLAALEITHSNVGGYLAVIVQ